MTKNSAVEMVPTLVNDSALKYVFWQKSQFKADKTVLFSGPWKCAKTRTSCRSSASESLPEALEGRKIHPDHGGGDGGDPTF